MPVPVPFHTKAPAHSVYKSRAQSGAPYPPPHSNLTHRLPLPPLGPPAAYGTREEWISSLPSWRRNKPRRIWEEEDVRATGRPSAEGFPQGLVNADNASIIKGERAQACIPPSLTLISQTSQSPLALYGHEMDEEVDDGMDSSLEFDVESQWSGHSSNNDDGSRMQVDRSHGGGYEPTRDAHMYERGAFTPVFEDALPDRDDRGDPGSSPLGPITPFADFVDRAVATAFDDRDYGNSFSNVPPASAPVYAPKDDYAYSQRAASYPQAEEPAPSIDPITAPSATIEYQKVVDPLADWMALYVWKACTTGIGLPEKYMPQGEHWDRHYPSLPPSYLANSIRSLFMSTLLQPSAIILAVWYIVKLPISFGPVPFGPDHVKELVFRTELLGLNEWRAIGKESMEMHAPFRLVLLGCMLANKWLDDHTFSNKTWHTISGVPIQSLNRLESMALGIFAYDLTVSPTDWSQWLDRVLAFHSSTMTNTHPQPISRPSSNPYAIVRRTVEALIEAAVKCGMPRPCGNPYCKDRHPEPVFISNNKHGDGRTSDGAQAVELEIDLDEDGPLREEYMPKRRVSRASSDRENVPLAYNPTQHTDPNWERTFAADRILPPPAKWSPAADEPLLRDGRHQYVAVRAPPVPLLRAPLVQQTQSYIPSYGYTQPWAPVPAMQSVHKAILPPIHPTASYHHGPPGMPLHSRSTSLSHGPTMGEQHYDHSRSQSQYQLGYACSDLRMTAGSYAYQQPTEFWPVADTYRYPSMRARPVDAVAPWAWA